MLNGSLPFLLTSQATHTDDDIDAPNHGVSYTSVGLLSLAAYPFALKLLWAPLVDAVYIPWFGRRKTWVAPCTLASGIV